MKTYLFIATLFLGLLSCTGKDRPETSSVSADTNFDVPEATAVPADLDGVVINGIRWATRNVYHPGTFAHSPHDAGKFFQWNRATAWASTGEASNWDSSIAEGVEWEGENDPCPEGWRVPTSRELNTLVNTPNVWKTYRNVTGRLFGTYPDVIFLPSAGHRSGVGAVRHSGTSGYYWSRTQSGNVGAMGMWFLQGSIGVCNGWIREVAFSIRCVAE